MKSLLLKLIRGVVATLAAFALGAFCLARAQNKYSQPAEAPTLPAPVAWNNNPPAAVPAPAPVAQPSSVTLCGACGAQISAATAIYVAAPVGGAVQYRPREDSREYLDRETRVVYVEAPLYAPAYYQSSLAAAVPFREVRVNPIPWEPQASFYRPARAFRPNHGNGKHDNRRN